jgi:hypothetical protein
MSRQPNPEHVQALEHRHSRDLVNPDGKGSDGAEVVPIATVNKDVEPIVTKRELWSYYRALQLLSHSLNII